MAGRGKGSKGVGPRVLGAAPPEEVLDVLALVTIALGFSKQLVPGTAQHR